MDVNSIKEILKNRRLELNLTLLDVAKAVGVSEATVSRWESGNIANMRRSRIAALAKVLQISPAVIMGWNEKDSDNEKSFSEKVDELFIQGGENYIKHYKKGVLENEKEVLIINNYRKLNDIGQHEAIKRVEELTYIDKYKITPEHLLLKAAHQIEGASEEDKQHDYDLMNDDNF